MTEFALFIRAVTPMGKNRVPMPELRKHLAKLGLKDVRTYISSGNVLLKTDLSKSEIEDLVQSLIKKKFGGDLPVVAVRISELKRMVKKNPFPPDPPKEVYFVFLKNKPAAAKLKSFTKLVEPPDEVVVSGSLVYQRVPDKYHQTKVHNGFIEKTLGVIATTRVSRTVERVVELSETSVGLARKR